MESNSELHDMKTELSSGSSLYLWLICLAATCGGFLFGYDVAVVSGVIPQVVKQFSLTSLQLGLLVSCVLWGCAIGAGFGGITLDRYGRKRVLILSSIILFISALLSGMAVSPASLIIARFLGGVGCGLASTACPLYMSEVSPEENRGRMVTLYHFSVCLGIVICVFVNWGIFSYAKSYSFAVNFSPYWQWLAIDQNWRAMFISEAVPGFLFLMCVCSLPESPRWLFINGRMQEANVILEKINGEDKARQVCEDIQETILLERQMRFSDLFTRKLRKPLFLSISICVFSEACGISAVLYYGPQLFEQAGLSLGHSLGGFSVIMLVNLLFNLVAIYFIDTAGRKKMLTIGSIGAMISLAIIGNCYYLEQTGYVLVFAMTAFVAFFACSIGPVKFVILSEIFPNQIRGKAIAVGTVCLWLTSAVVAQLFPMMREVMHTGHIFLIFALDIAVLLMVVRVFLPETKGRTIEDIERSWFVRK